MYFRKDVQVLVCIRKRDCSKMMSLHNSTIKVFLRKTLQCKASIWFSIKALQRERLPFLILIFLGSLISLSCKDIEEEFSGLVGRVALGPVENARIRVYDGSQFLGLESSLGFIAQTSSDQRGNFRIVIPDAFIGRSLIVVADFPEDDLSTPDQDESASYLRFDGQRVVLGADDAPWVAMVDFFEGLEVPVTLSPWSTVAFYALSNKPDAEVGQGNARYVQDLIFQTHRSLGVSLGLGADLSRVFPAQPQLSSQHPQASKLLRDKTADSAALLYTLLQLERAALNFVAATSDPDDDVLDFLQALYDDARDGLLDGQLHNQALDFFVQPGAPLLIGLFDDGGSRIMGFIRDEGIISSTERAEIEAASTTIYPSPSEILKAQEQSTGALGPIQIQEVLPRLVPRGGGVEVSVKGSGFVHGFELLFASGTNPFQPSGSLLRIKQNPAENQITFFSHQEIRFLSPDFSAPGVAGGFKLSSTESFKQTNLFVRFDLDGSGRSKSFLDRFAGHLDQFIATDLHLLSAQILKAEAGVSFKPRLESGVETSLNIGNRTTDPGSLDPGQDQVYFLEFGLYNARSTTLDQITLELEESKIFLASSLSLGSPQEFELDHFNGTKINPLLLFETNQELQNKGLSLSEKTFGILRIPFTYNQDEVGSTSSSALQYGQEIVLEPVLRALDASTSLEVLSNQNASLPQLQIQTTLENPDLTPQVTSGGLSLIPGVVQAGDGFSLDWVVQSQGLVLNAHRTFDVQTLFIRVESGGAEPRTLNLQRMPFNQTFFPLRSSGFVSLEGLGFENSGTSQTAKVPFQVLSSPTTLRLDFSSLAGETGQVQIDLQLQWQEVKTGLRGELTDSITFTVNP